MCLQKKAFLSKAQSSHSSRFKTLICKCSPCGCGRVSKLFSDSRSQPTDQSRGSGGPYTYTTYIHIHIHVHIHIHIFIQVHMYVYINTYGLPPLRSAGKLSQIMLLTSGTS